jgi:uncharacterized protein
LAKSHIIEIDLNPEALHDPSALTLLLSQKLARDVESLHYRILKKSLDSRRSPVFRYRIEVSESAFSDEISWSDKYQMVDASKSVIIIGAGPAGYFAALECLLLGLRPVILERGKNVRDRRRDLRQIQQFHQVNPDSNYCFGEGGAGTYSDGKLYTRSNKRGDIKKVLSQLVDHGASPEIQYEAHPHIGSNRLPELIQNIRNTIERYGGEIHFNTRVTDLLLQQGHIRGVVAGDVEFNSSAVILATGHSARDIFYLLHQKGLSLEAKPFALGVRIEHPQQLIDQQQYRMTTRPSSLPPANYSLTCTIGDTGIFSFCMCPGGLMVPAATAPGEIVLNGMSLSRRDSPFANSGTVVSIQPALLNPNPEVFTSLQFQQEVEQKIFQAGDGSQRAPGQRLTDFLIGKVSASIPAHSYIPGIWSAPVHELLPGFVVKHLRQGIGQFSKQLKGYITEEAIVVATESRTSSPIRIPRNSVSMHPQCIGLFPCGEGAGYAGGIVSAAMDGQYVARACKEYLS